MYHQPKIFYYCSDHNRPTGGEKHSYQHVDILNENGFTAFAYHREPGFRLSWFDNETRTVDSQQFANAYDPERDFLVFPETLGSRMLAWPGRRVIFNKNAFYGFGALGVEPSSSCPYTDPNTKAVFAVSEHNRRQLEFVFPGVRVLPVWASISSKLFTPPPLHEKQRIVCSIDKNRFHVAAVFQSFLSRTRDASEGWEWRFLAGLHEAELAAALRSSTAFVFTNTDEGLGRMPIEAMACGCLLVSYRNGPLAEYAPSYLHWDYGDLAGLGSWLDCIMQDKVPDRQACIDEGIQIAAQFNRERQCRSVCEAWQNVMSTN